MSNAKKKVQHKILQALEERRIDYEKKLNTKEKFDQPISIEEISNKISFPLDKTTECTWELYNEQKLIGFDKRVNKFFIIDEGRTMLYSGVFLSEAQSVYLIERNLMLQIEKMEYEQTVRKLNEELAISGLLKNWWWLIAAAVVLGTAIGKYLAFT